MATKKPVSTGPRASVEAPEAAGAVSALVSVVFPRELVFRAFLGDARVELGRGEGPGSLDHPTISRSHVAIEWDGSAHWISDRGSRHGTRLMREQVGRAPRLLHDNAVIGAGDVVLVYEVDRSRAQEAHAVWRDRIPGESIAARDLRRAVACAAPDPSPALLVGATGTGKEWTARELHRLSKRAGNLVAVNCAALGRELVESQLFGHVRGAFTGATSDEKGFFRAADGGTLFLDEVGELPDALQPKLLRALQEHEVQPVGSVRPIPVDVRIVAATNRDLREEVDRGRFRRDLYARLALFEIHVPALSERRVDILPWFQRLRADFHERRDLPEPASGLPFTPDAAEAIVCHAWPENLRGLDRLVHHLSSAAPTNRPLGLGDLPAWLRARGADPGRLFAPADRGRNLTAQGLAAQEPGNPSPKRRAAPGRAELVALVEQLDGNVAAVARALQCERRQVYRWLSAAGIDRREVRGSGGG